MNGWSSGSSAVAGSPTTSSNYSAVAWLADLRLASLRKMDSIEALAAHY